LLGGSTQAFSHSVSALLFWEIVVLTAYPMNRWHPWTVKSSFDASFTADAEFLHAVLGSGRTAEGFAVGLCVAWQNLVQIGKKPKKNNVNGNAITH
jgi:hypothetical protein